MERKIIAIGVLSVLLGAAVGACGAFALREVNMQREAMARQQRDLADIVAAMADIEVNLSKLLVVSGARQSVELLGETALLAQHVESGLAHMDAGEQTTGSAMKFAGQMGQYSLALAAQVSGGGMISGSDEKQIESMRRTCRALGEQLAQGQTANAADPLGDEGQSAIEYPSLIYDGPFSDGRTDGKTLGLTGERLARQQAREAAARYAGVTASQVTDAADSGGRFEAFGFTADTPDGKIAVQVTGQGGHLLWMMPEQAAFTARYSQETCLQNARVYLADVGFGQMEPCFVQQYDGMVVANFAAVQDGVTLYPDQVKVQVSMETGRVVGAECSQYLSNHTTRTDVEPTITEKQAGDMVSAKLTIRTRRLCVIPTEAGESLCWGFECAEGNDRYWAFVSAETGEMEQLLRVIETAQGETVM